MVPQYEKFDSRELASCLRHYDLGRITSIQEFSRGSRNAPKVVIESDRGKFLFKRRAPGKNDPDRVAFTHQIQLKLAAHDFPLARLVPTRKGHRTMLLRHGCIYEMFEYVEGGEYDGSAEATYDAGRTLGLYHKLLRDARSEYRPPAGSYHGATAIREAIQNTVGALPIEKRPPAEIIMATVSYLAEIYHYCGQQAERRGLGDWHRQIVHGDWHPGNILFRNKRVAAVIDYDSARIQQRIIDVANGALHFSITGGGGKPETWPDHIDKERYQEFLRGYASIGGISAREIETIPYLMCEAMIAEAVLPIAATGSFGHVEGLPFLQMIQRKVEWIMANTDDLHVAVRA